MTQNSIPSHGELFNPTLQALRKLGGSGGIQEIQDEVVAILGLSDEQIAELHKPSKSNQTKISYNLGWARTYLKKYGLIDNSQRGIWSLTREGQQTHKVNATQVRDAVVEMSRKDKQSQLSDELDDEEWRVTLSDFLKEMNPTAFERLFQRVLRESGFLQVEVTGSSGDGGIDGFGVMRIGGFLSFRVLFQCKRYKGSIGAGIVRDFRGAMIGRTDKGLIVTTGNFTPAALREATRDGAPEIDLIDGEQLMDKLKELSLGVKTEKVVTERVTVNPDFFAGI